MPHEQVIVHRLLHDLRYGGRRELDVGVVLGLAGAFVAGEPEAGDGPELGEVGVHLGFVEAVRDVPDVEDAAFVGLWGERSGKNGWG